MVDTSLKLSNVPSNQCSWETLLCSTPSAINESSLQCEPSGEVNTSVPSQSNAPFIVDIEPTLAEQAANVGSGVLDYVGQTLYFILSGGGRLVKKSVGVGFTAVGAGCALPDEALNYPPDEEVPTKNPRQENQTPDAGALPLDAGTACTPTCEDGFLDPDRIKDGFGLCISFKEIIEGNNLTGSLPRLGSSLVDYDGDSRPDVYIFNDGQPNQLFRNTPEGFVDVSVAAGLNVGGDSRHAAWHDYDADGDVDLLLAGNGGSRLYRNDSGQFNPILAPNGINNPLTGKAALWIGSNVLLATDNRTYFYRYLGGDQFEEKTSEAGLFDTGDGAAIVTADYDGDGDLDIYLANSTGRNRLFKNAGNGSYQSVELQAGVEGRGGSTDAQWIKLLPTDPFSLYVANWDAANHLFISQENGVYSDQAGNLGVQDPGNTVRSLWGDFLKEGVPSLFLGRWNQSNLFYVPVYTAEGTISGYKDISYPLHLNIEGKTVNAQSADFNQDGLLDLLVVLADGGIKIFENKTRLVEVCNL